MANDVGSIQRGLRDSDHHYFILSRAAAQDETLSWEARGVLAYLLSKPDDWIVQPHDLQQCCGRDKVYKILDELIAHKYLIRITNRQKSGALNGYQYKVYEQPLIDGETPFPDSPYTVQPYTANTDSTDQRVLQSKDSTKKDSTANAVRRAGKQERLIAEIEEVFDDIGLDLQSDLESEDHSIPRPAPKPAKPPQTHMEPICKFLYGALGGEFGRPLLPDGIKLGAFARLSQNYKTNYTAEIGDRLEQAGWLYASWIEAEKPVLTWNVGEVTNAVRLGLAMAQRGVTPDLIAPFCANTRLDKFWQGKALGFEYVAKHITLPDQTTRPAKTINDIEREQANYRTANPYKGILE